MCLRDSVHSPAKYLSLNLGSCQYISAHVRIQIHIHVYIIMSMIYINSSSLIVKIVVELPLMNAKKSKDCWSAMKRPRASS